jgi:hypothetical protein
MNCFQYLLGLHEVCQFQSIEGARYGLASKSELRRWFNDKAVRINYEFVKALDELPPHIVDVVLFPKNKKKRTTLVHEDCQFIQVAKDEDESP